MCTELNFINSGVVIIIYQLRIDTGVSDRVLYVSQAIKATNFVHTISNMTVNKLSLQTLCKLKEVV